jgi:hypothetical protein
MERDTSTLKHRSWPAGMTFLGVGMMIGGGVDMVGTGGAMFIIGVIVALVGAAFLVART